MRISEDLQEGSNKTNKNWWNKIEIGVKFICIMAILFAILSVFKEELSRCLANDVLKTVQSFQIWRMMTSFLIPGYYNVSMISVSILLIIIKLAIHLYIFTKIANIERQYSTAYLVINCCVQPIVFNTALVVIYYPFIAFDKISQPSIAYGIFPLIMNILWQSVALDQNVSMKIIFISYQLKFKYIAAAILLLQVVVQRINGGLVTASIVCTCLAYYQHIVRKRLFLTLPLSVYQGFDSIIPQKIKCFKAYTKVEEVVFELQPRCSKGLFDQNKSEQISNTESNVISSSSQKRTKKISKKFKEHWTNKYQNSSSQMDETKRNDSKEEEIVEQVHQNDLNNQQHAEKDITQQIMSSSLAQINKLAPSYQSVTPQPQQPMLRQQIIQEERHGQAKYERREMKEQYDDDDFT